MIKLRFLIFSLFVSASFLNIGCFAAADPGAPPPTDQNGEGPNLPPQRIIQPAVNNGQQPHLPRAQILAADEAIELSQAEHPISPDLRRPEERAALIRARFAQHQP